MKNVAAGHEDFYYWGPMGAALGLNTRFQGRWGLITVFSAKHLGSFLYNFYTSPPHHLSAVMGTGTHKYAADLASFVGHDSKF